MADIVSQPWFWPAVIVSVGLPLVLIGLTEMHNAMARRGSRAAPIVLMVRNYLVPVAGVLVLLSQPGAWQGEGTWPKVIWTIFGLLVIVVTINAINHLVFHRGEKGSWRDRFPSIFSDLIRFVFIVVGIALLFWWVWDADVAGVFAALGITSIIVGPRAAERGRIDRVGAVPDLRGAVPDRRLARHRRRRAVRSSR